MIVAGSSSGDLVEGVALLELAVAEIAPKEELLVLIATESSKVFMLVRVKLSENLLHLAVRIVSIGQCVLVAIQIEVYFTIHEHGH